MNIPLLAAILRIADECENNWTRALRPPAYELYIKSGKDVAKAFRRNIENVEFCHDGECVIMHVPRGPEPDPDLELAALVATAQTGSKVQKVLRAWSPRLADAGVRFDHLYFERGGRLYASDAAGFEDDSIAWLDTAERDCLRDFTSALQKLKMGGAPKIPLASVEADIHRSLSRREKWLLGRVGEAERAWRFDRMANGQELVRFVQPLAVDPLVQRLKRNAGGHTSPLESESEFHARVFHCLRQLSSGTAGYAYLPWASLEAKLHRRLDAKHRLMVMQMGRCVLGLKIDFGRTPGEIKIELDHTKASQIQEFFSSPKPPPGADPADALRALIRIWRGTAGFPSVPWAAIAEKSGRQITVDDKNWLLRFAQEYPDLRVNAAGVHTDLQAPQLEELIAELERRIRCQNTSPPAATP